MEGWSSVLDATDRGDRKVKESEELWELGS